MTYPELVEFCGDERQAHFLSTKLPYQQMTEAELVDRVAALMVRVKERTPGRSNLTLEYVGARSGVIFCGRDRMRSK
jgi:hypothetical protein